MFVETELSESNKISHILKSQDFWDNFFLVASCILAGWSLVIWYLLNWEYLPDWLPLPGFPLIDVLRNKAKNGIVSQKSGNLGSNR
jgi:hypothetical protein